jgi:hypothetical protein
MAKGKYKARKHNRDAAQVADDLARVRAELAVEQDRLAATRERATLDARLRTELAEAVAARDAACAPQLIRIAADRDVIRSATRDLHGSTRQIGRHNQRVIDWAWDHFGSEAFYAIVSGNRAFVHEGVASHGLSSQATEVIQRARGLRKHAPLDFTPQQRKAMSEAAAAATGVALPEDVSGINEGEAWNVYTESIEADPAGQIAFKTPVPWLDIAADPEHPISRVLGAHSSTAPVTVDAADPVPAVADLSTGTAALRDVATAAGATRVADAFLSTLQQSVNLAVRSQIPALLSPSSPYPAPADAAAVQAWYAVAAMGGWGRHRTPGNGRIAVAAAAAVPYWLPPGHTIAYLDSEPLSDDDIDDMRLPFAQVLVTFAEPARLPASDRAALPTDDARMAWIDHLVTDSAAEPDQREVMLAATNNFTAPIPSLWDAIAARGAHIEAVLLLADAHGHLDDLFAWCVAIPSTTAGATLGRWVIPASRSATTFANLVVNAAAVAAWADWHRPGHSRGAAEEAAEQLPGNEKASREQKRLDDTVHVLNVTATTPASDASITGVPTGRTTAPHRRRGHWRRQHYGPGRVDVRRIRIAPVMVNAGRFGSGRPQIYRLPRPTLAETHADR